MSTTPQIPILAIKCKKCGKPFFAHVLSRPIDEESAELIAESVKNGDEPYICTEVRFGCNCETGTESDDE